MDAFNIFGGEKSKCDKCKGSGVCQTCHGKGTIKEKRPETIAVPPKGEQDDSYHREFQTSLRKIDFRSVNWGATLGINSMRAFFGGFLFALLLISLGDHSVGLAPIIFVIAYLFVYVPLALFLGFLGRLFSWITIPVLDRPITDVLALMLIPGFMLVLMGDPIMFFLQKLRPHLFPVTRYGFLHFNLILFVER